jgi:2-isopropylmalate synthase
MGRERKLRMFEALLRVGFKEIEVGFPSASGTDYDFLRFLIEGGHIPDDVTVQVLTPSREALIARTFEALRGARRAIVHLYNSTSEVQRRVVFGLDRAGIRDLAVRGARQVRALADQADGEIVFEYSPESFTGTELDFALEVSDAVSEVWGPTAAHPMILNLPATVEVSTPNIYADSVEWMSRHLARREAIQISLHAHNDRGCAVAATELGLLAGADRVEGTLFGNGERTGNVDVVTVAMNLYTQGIDPGLRLDDLPWLVHIAETCNQLPVHPRHPYAGQLVFTAFSGSHQDAIRKGLAAYAAGDGRTWEVPYLPLSPGDVGREYEPVVRINSQSGKSGIAFVLEHSHGLQLPRRLAVELSEAVQQVTDATGAELSPEQVLGIFESGYLRREGRLTLVDYEVLHPTGGRCRVSATLEDAGQCFQVEGEGNGPIDAFVSSLTATSGLDIQVLDYSEHALGDGAAAEAMTYVELRRGEDVAFGAGRHSDIVTASLQAVVSGINRLPGVAVGAAPIRSPRAP